MKCGFCMSTCPVYGIDQLETHVARGRNMLIRDAEREEIPDGTIGRPFPIVSCANDARRSARPRSLPLESISRPGSSWWTSGGSLPENNPSSDPEAPFGSGENPRFVRDFARDGPERGKAASASGRSRQPCCAEGLSLPRLSGIFFQQPPSRAHSPQRQASRSGGKSPFSRLQFRILFFRCGDGCCGGALRGWV